MSADREDELRALLQAHRKAAEGVRPWGIGLGLLTALATLLGLFLAMEHKFTRRMLLAFKRL